MFSIHVKTILQSNVTNKLYGWLASMKCNWKRNAVSSMSHRTVKFSSMLINKKYIFSQYFTVYSAFQRLYFFRKKYLTCQNLYICTVNKLYKVICMKYQPYKVFFSGRKWLNMWRGNCWFCFRRLNWLVRSSLGKSIQMSYLLLA